MREDRKLAEELDGVEDFTNDVFDAMENNFTCSSASSTFTVDPDCSHRPDKRKSKKSSNKEDARDGRKRTKRSKEFSSALEKAKNDQFYLENDPLDKMNTDLEFLVHSVKSDATHKVQIKNAPSCSCGYFTRKERSREQICKHIIWVYLSVIGLDEDNDIIMQVALTNRELQQIFTGSRLVPITRIRMSAGSTGLQQIEIDAILAGQEPPRWVVTKLTDDQDECCYSCDISRMIKGRLAVVCDGVHIPLGKNRPEKKRFYFCAVQECLRKKPSMSNVVVPPVAISISEEGDIVTKEDIALLLVRKVPIST